MSKNNNKRIIKSISFALGGYNMSSGKDKDVSSTPSKSIKTHVLSAPALKLMNMVIAQVNPCAETPPKTIELRIKDMSLPGTGISRSLLYAKLPEMCAELMHLNICTREKNRKTHYFTESAINVFSKVTKEGYENQETGHVTLDRVIFTLTDDITPYIYQIDAPYISYLQTMQGQFKSTYSIRMYEMIRSFHSYNNPVNFTRSTTLSIGEIRVILGVPEGRYPAFPQLKQRVIDVASKEVNELSDVYVSNDVNRRGRKATSVKFSFYNTRKSEKNGQTSLPALSKKEDTKSSEKQPMPARELMEGGELQSYPEGYDSAVALQVKTVIPEITEKQIIDLFKDYGRAIVQESASDYAAAQPKKVSDPVKYFSGICWNKANESSSRAFGTQASSQQLYDTRWAHTTKGASRILSNF